jgi:hypothetical protein
MARSLRRSVGVGVIVACMIMLVGCGPRRPETVPISGKVTLDGGPWPIKGMIIFSCSQPAKGFPSRPGKATFNTDGTFVVGTYEKDDGLMPGEYRVGVICEEGAQSTESIPKSYGASRYQSPARSGLTLTVPPGSDPITVSYNVSSK